MKNKIEMTLLALVAFGLGLVVMKTLSRTDNLVVTVAERQLAKNIFSSGCEVGIMKNCPISNQEDCRKFCILFTEANPDVIDLILKGNKNK